MQVPLSRRNGLIVVLALAAVALAGTLAFFFRGEKPQFVEYRMPDTLESPTAIAAGADGDVWFTIDRSDVIGRVHNGAIERISTSGRNIEPLGVGVGARWQRLVYGRCRRRRRACDPGRARFPASSSIRRSCGLDGSPSRLTARHGSPSRPATASRKSRTAALFATRSNRRAAVPLASPWLQAAWCGRRCRLAISCCA